MTAAGNESSPSGPRKTCVQSKHCWLQRLDFLSLSGFRTPDHQCSSHSSSQELDIQVHLWLDTIVLSQKTGIPAWQKNSPDSKASSAPKNYQTFSKLIQTSAKPPYEHDYATLPDGFSAYFTNCIVGIEWKIACNYVWIQLLNPSIRTCSKIFTCECQHSSKQGKPTGDHGLPWANHWAISETNAKVKMST